MSAGVQLKLAGMRRAAKKYNANLDIARTFLVNLALSRESREVSADDIPQDIILGNAAGSLFTEKIIWEFTGRWKPSTRDRSHSRYVRIWRLK